MAREHTTPNEVKIIGRYTVDLPFAAGGMASVHLGRAKGPMGFARTVAVKRLLPSLASDPAFTARFLDEARLASRVRHVNVVPTLDVVAEQDDLLIVMEYVAGLSLANVLAQPSLTAAEGAPVPLPIVSAIVSDVLEGLHAAHTATTEAGEQLALVHRDVSPQNVLVGSDGIARVIDFGIATATERHHLSGDNHVRGKLGYMAPEQLLGEAVTFAADVYAASVMLWELLAHRRLMAKDTDGFVERVLLGDHDGPRKYAPAVPVALEAIVMQGLAASPSRRFSSAHEMAIALQATCPRASALEVASWLVEVAAAPLKERAEDVTRFESMPERRLSQLRPSALGLVVYDPTATVTERLARLPSPSVHEPLRAKAPRRRGRALAAVTASLFLVAVAVVVRVRERSRDRALPSEPVVAALSETTPAPSEAAATAGSEEALRTAAPLTTATPLTSPARDGGAPRREGPVAPSRARASGAGVGASCKVPFYFDTDGTKHYRPECLR